MTPPRTRSLYHIHSCMSRVGSSENGQYRSAVKVSTCNTFTQLLGFAG
jgi:hypothetical protein